MSPNSESMSSSLFWLEILAGSHSEYILTEAMARAAQNLSIMIGRPISVEPPRVEVIPLHRLSTYVGDPETETVAIYLLIEGDLRGQALLMFSLEDGLYLANKILANSSQHTTRLDNLARSALGELADMMLSAFLNVVVEHTAKKSVKPSPPAVMVDMAGAILDIVASTTIVANSDMLMVIETAFKDAEKTMLCRFWVLPDPDGNVL